MGGAVAVLYLPWHLQFGALGRKKENDRDTSWQHKQSLTAIALDPVVAQGRWVWVARGVEPSSNADALQLQLLFSPIRQPHRKGRIPQESFSVTHPGGRGRSTNCFAHAVLQVVRALRVPFGLGQSVTGTWAARYWPPYRGTLVDRRLFQRCAVIIPAACQV